MSCIENEKWICVKIFFRFFLIFSFSFRGRTKKFWKEFSDRCNTTQRNATKRKTKVTCKSKNNENNFIFYFIHPKIAKPTNKKLFGRTKSELNRSRKMFCWLSFAFCYKTFTSLLEKMGNKVGKATEGVRNRMSFRQRRLNDDNMTEYSDLYVRTKFQNIPVLTPDEKEVVRSSWQIIQTKLDKVNICLNIHWFSIPTSLWLLLNISKFQVSLASHAKNYARHSNI